MRSEADTKEAISGVQSENTATDPPKDEGGTWTVLENMDAPGGDVETVATMTIDDLKRKVKDNNWSAFYTWQDYAYFKNFPYQLEAGHCKRAEGWEDKFYIFTPSSETIKRKRPPYPFDAVASPLVLVKKGSCRQIVLEHATDFKSGGGSYFPLTLTGSQGVAQAIVCTTEYADETGDKPFFSQSLGVGAIESAISVRWDADGGFFTRESDGFVMDVWQGKMSLDDKLWMVRDGLDGALPDTRAPSTGRCFLLNDDGTVSPANNPQLVLGNSRREGTWTMIENMEFNDVNVYYANWKSSNLSIDDLKRKVQENNWSGFVVTGDYVYCKSTYFQLEEGHCTRCNGYESQMYIFTSAGEDAKKSKPPLPPYPFDAAAPSLVLVKRGSPRQIVLEHAGNFLASTGNAEAFFPLTLSGVGPPQAIVNKVENPDEIGVAPFYNQELGIGGVDLAIRVRWDAEGGFFIREKDGFVLDVWSKNCAFDDKLWMTRSGIDGSLADTRTPGKTRSFLINEDGTVSPLKAPNLVLGNFKREGTWRVLNNVDMLYQGDVYSASMSATTIEELQRKVQENNWSSITINGEYAYCKSFRYQIEEVYLKSTDYETKFYIFTAADEEKSSSVVRRLQDALAASSAIEETGEQSAVMLGR